MYGYGGFDIVGVVFFALTAWRAQANDALSTARVAEHIVAMCHEVKDWESLGEYMIVLSKRRGQLKLPLVKMVQKAAACLDTAPDLATTLRLIETLRAVTAGKIHVEVERARVTLRLAKIREEEGKLDEAVEVLQELQVETFGSMDKREKAEFILEQMRLSLLRKDYTKTLILSKKITRRFFDDEAQHDLKLVYFGYLVAMARPAHAYLDLCHYSRAVYDTPRVQQDEAAARAALADTACYLALAPYTNEQVAGRGRGGAGRCVGSPSLLVLFFSS